MNHETLMAQGPVECRVRPLVVVQKVWVQVSADYDAADTNHDQATKRSRLE